MFLMLLQVENQRYQPLSVATTRFYEQQKTKNLPTVVTFPPLLVLCDAKSNVVQESSMNHFKISLEDTFQQSTPSFFLSPKSETELVASLKCPKIYISCPQGQPENCPGSSSTGHCVQECVSKLGCFASS